MQTSEHYPSKNVINPKTHKKLATFATQTKHSI